MSYDSLKGKVEEHQEKKKKYTEDKIEFDDAFMRFQAAEHFTERLDESIRERIWETGLEFEENKKILELQAEVLREEREAMISEINQKIKEISEKRKELSAHAGNKYGGGIKDAMAVCDKCIVKYQDLLERIDTHSSDTGANSETQGKYFKEEKERFSELQVQEDTIPVLANMPPQIKHTLQNYTDKGYIAINGYLRGKSEKTDNSVKQKIREIDSVMKKMKTKSDMTVYRGVSSDVSMGRTGTGKSLSQYSDQELIGKHLFDGAFVSTSVQENSAFKRDTMLVISVPAGAHGIYLGDISLYKKQKEFLLDRNQDFIVRRVENKNNKRYIYVDALKR